MKQPEFVTEEASQFYTTAVDEYRFTTEAELRILASAGHSLDHFTLADRIIQRDGILDAKGKISGAVVVAEKSQRQFLSLCRLLSLHEPAEITQPTHIKARPGPKPKIRAAR